MSRLTLVHITVCVLSLIVNTTTQLSITNEKLPECCNSGGGEETGIDSGTGCALLYKCEELNCTKNANFCEGVTHGLFNRSGTDLFKDSNEINEKNQKYCISKLDEGVENDLKYKVCLFEERNELIQELYFWTTLFSTIIVLITILIFLLNWEGQNIHTWAQFSHCVSLFFLLICWTLRRYLTNTKEFHDESTICIAVAISTHYFYISTFTWMAVINYDLLKMLSRVNRTSFKKHQRFPTFSSFSIIGWGFPIVIISIGLVMTLFSRYFNNFPTFLEPSYAKEKCYISNDGTWIYSIFPTTVLFILILSQFIRTLKIFCLKKPNHQSSAYLLEKLNIKRNVLFVKIFAIMGTVWIFDVITSVITVYDPAANNDWYIILMDMIVLLQAVPIFFIYSCRPQTLNQLERKYESLSPCLDVCRFLFCVSTHEPELLPVTNLRMHRRSTISPLPEPQGVYDR